LNHGIITIRLFGVLTDSGPAPISKCGYRLLFVVTGSSG